MVPLGGIIEWFGAIANIPAGWQLCDGTNGTPDLRGRMVKGAGPADPVDGVGGTLEHVHDNVDIGHLHGPAATVNCAGSGPAINWDGEANSATATATIANETVEALPPFHNLAFIQRMV